MRKNKFCHYRGLYRGLLASEIGAYRARRELRVRLYYWDARLTTPKGKAR